MDDEIKSIQFNIPSCPSILQRRIKRFESSLEARGISLLVGIRFGARFPVCPLRYSQKGREGSTVTAPSQRHIRSRQAAGLTGQIVD